MRMLGITREYAGLEHFEARDGQTLAALEDLAALL